MVMQVVDVSFFRNPLTVDLRAHFLFSHILQRLAYLLSETLSSLFTVEMNIVTQLSLILISNKRL